MLARPRSELLSLRLGSRELDGLHAPCELAEDQFAFQTRDHLADAGVDAGAEADMARRNPLDVEAVGSVPACGIAVGGSHEQQHLAMRPGSRRREAEQRMLLDLLNRILPL